MKTCKKFWTINSLEEGKMELSLYGDIAEKSWWGDEITPQEFLSDLKQCNDSDLDVRINSGGGDVFAAHSIYNMLKRYKGKVTVYIDGLCASAATIIACAADTVVMPKNALYMIHNPSVFLSDAYDAEALEQLSQYLATVKQTIVNVYKERVTQLSEKELIKLMDDETWLTADEAKEYGLVDIVEGRVENSLVLNNGILTVNKASCKYAIKNESKIKQVIRGKENCMKDTRETVWNRLGEMLGIYDGNDRTTTVDAVEIERKRIIALDELKGKNVAIDRIVEVAKKSGKTVDEVKPFVTALSDLPEKDSVALETMNKLITDNLQSGALNVTVNGKTAEDSKDVEAIRKKTLEEVVNYANAMRGGY